MGQSLGAKMRGGEALYKMCQRIGLTLAIMMSASIYFCATFLAGMYTDGSGNYSKYRYCFIHRCVRSTVKVSIEITSGALRGAGDTVWPLILILSDHASFD